MRVECREVQSKMLIIARPPFPEHLLLRDTLYLLQGIDGRYVRFAVRPPPEQNPYLTEKGRAGDGTAFALGKEGGVVEPLGMEADIVGIDIIAEEDKVSTDQSRCRVALSLWTRLHACSSCRRAAR